LIPAIAFVIALLIFRKFSLNEAEHALLKEDIEAREAR
jgi:Na+/melibiose symporter-like transporter